jgi:peptide/nickel transport system permease protein
LGATALALRRLAASLLVLLLVSAVVYWGTAVLPGDALTAVLPMDILQTISPEELARRRTELGIDRPHLVQFGEFLGRVVQLDFGRTTVTREDVLERIDHPLRNSLLLAGLTAIAAPLAAVALAVASVMRPSPAARSSPMPCRNSSPATCSSSSSPCCCRSRPPSSCCPPPRPRSTCSA